MIIMTKILKVSFRAFMRFLVWLVIIEFVCVSEIFVRLSFINAFILVFVIGLEYYVIHKIITIFSYYFRLFSYSNLLNLFFLTI